MNEATIRLTVFAGVLALLASWELFAPHHQARRGSRWPGNLGLVALDTLIVRIVFPAAAVGAAVFAGAQGWGVLNQLSAPAWIEIVVALVLLDLLIYGQHVLFHRVPLLWRLHRVHHSDAVMDVTTGLRFHPIEILVSMAIKIAAVVAIGASPLAVLLFEVLLNASAMFTHANVRLPRGTDRLIRPVFVTPDMHRVHHSDVPRETHSNFGFNLALWDRAFGTYRAQPAAGHADMTIGVAEWRDPGEARLDRMLSQPFRRARQGDRHGTSIEGRDLDG